MYVSMKTKTWRDLYVLIMEIHCQVEKKKTKLYIQDIPTVCMTDHFYNYIFTNAQIDIENFGRIHLKEFSSGCCWVS